MKYRTLQGSPIYYPRNYIHRFTILFSFFFFFFFDFRFKSSRFIYAFALKRRSNEMAVVKGTNCIRN